jgi:hypothetical protein
VDFYDTTTQGIITGVVSLTIYLFSKFKQGSTPELGAGITVLLSGAGVIAGLQLCMITFSKFECNNNFMETNRVYVFLGGAAIIWTSLSTLYSLCKKSLVTP